MAERDHNADNQECKEANTTTESTHVFPLLQFLPIACR